MRKPDPNPHPISIEMGTALVPLPPAGTDLASFEAATASARHFRTQSRAPETRRAYAHWVKVYVGWCKGNDREPFAGSVETVAGFVAWLANGRDGTDKVPAATTVTQALSAIHLAQAAAGTPLNPKDASYVLLKETMRGIRRQIAQVRSIRKARPLKRDQLQKIIALYRDDDPQEARDKALLALGFAAGRRRSEIVGLDWMVRGTGTGVLTQDEKGLVIQLTTSKTRQEGGEAPYILPAKDVARTCAAVENWVRLRGIAPGEPVFPARTTSDGFVASRYAGVVWDRDKQQWRAQIRRLEVKKWKAYHTLGWFATQEAAKAAYLGAGGVESIRPPVRADRVAGRTVSGIVKRALARYFAETPEGRRVKAADRRALLKLYSSHSMRSGFVTDAFDRKQPIHKIKAMTGHVSDDILLGYARVQADYDDSVLQGVGL